MAETDEVSENVNSSTLPRSARRCRIPRLNRSTSVRLKNDNLDRIRYQTRPKSMSMSRDFSWQLDDGYGNMGSVASMPFSVDDDSSVKSFGSFVSYTSFASQSQCTEASVSRPISRCHYGKKYVLHCDRHLAKPEEYLTPTQRKDKEIRQLKSSLMKQTKSSEAKDAEIERLKTEVQRLQETVTELQGRKHDLMNSSQESDNLEDSLNPKNSTSVISFESNDSGHSEIQTVARTNDDSGISNAMSLSLSPRHSSEFEDLDQSAKVLTDDKAVGTDFAFLDCLPPTRACSGCLSLRDTPMKGIIISSDVEKFPEDLAQPKLSQEFESFLGTYKQELDQLKSQHKEHYQDLKERFNERVDDLLQKLSEANTRYLELRPLFDRAQDKILNIESQLTDVQKDIEGQEDYHNQMYLKMYRWKNVFKACLCVSVAGLAFKHLRPFVNSIDFYSIPHYFSPSLAYDNLKHLTNLVEFRVHN